MELDYTRRIYLKSLKKTMFQKSTLLVKLLTKENLLEFFHQLTTYQKRRQMRVSKVDFSSIKITQEKVIKDTVEISTIEIKLRKVCGNNVDFSTIEITSKKVCENNVDFLDIEIRSKKVRGNNMDFSTIETTAKKVRGNNMDIFTSKITPKKVRGNNVDFSFCEITSKKYVTMMWKFVQIWSSTYRRNIDVESTSIRRCLLVG